VTRICVFCGSAVGVRPAYAEAARGLGRELARRGLGLVYGGGSVGLMGVLADAVLVEGGEVIGVIPAPLATRELAHAGLTKLHVVPSMHERKATMARLSDGFVALPGGLGTLEETLEVLTWAQLGIHRKPVGVLDVEGYWSALERMLAHAVGEGFVRPEHAALLLRGTSASELLDRFAAWRAPAIPRAWLDASQT
jgi:uncharacterized protein (TIGR00730 family)